MRAVMKKERKTTDIKAVAVVYKGDGDEKLRAAYRLLAKIALRDYLPDNPVKQESVKA
jgi:hypothetical protein